MKGVANAKRLVSEIDMVANRLRKMEESFGMTHGVSEQLKSYAKFIETVGEVMPKKFENIYEDGEGDAD